MPYPIQFNGTFRYHLFNIRIAPVRRVHFDTWLGIVVRNNLMFAMEQVRVAELGMSLRELVNSLPIGTDHPLHAELKEGFPRAYSLHVYTHCDPSRTELTVAAGEVVGIGLCLVGELANYYPYFVQALRLMCRRALGRPLQPFRLLDVHEASTQNVCAHLLATEQSDYFGALRHPFSQPHLPAPDGKAVTFGIRYISPTCLVKPSTKKDTSLSYQDKQNLFPSFYQLMRSVTHRYHKLNLLYAQQGPHGVPAASSLFTDMDAYLLEAGRATLLSAHIDLLTLHAPQQHNKGAAMQLSGYVGQTVFRGWCAHYLPLLQFIQPLGVGNGVVYGLGRYEVME